MGVRIALAALVARAGVRGTRARAVETGVNETLGHNMSIPHTAGKLGADWVRLWALWQDMEPAPGTYNAHLIGVMNQRIAALKARGVKVLVVVHRAPAWASGGRGGTAPPSNPAAFGRVHGPDRPARARRRRLGAVERARQRRVLGRRAPTPPRTRRCCASAYPAIKAVQPGDAVVTGGMVGNDMDFLAGALRATARRARSTRSACTPTRRA